MITHLTGTVTAVGGTWAALDLGGFGLRVLCTPQTAMALRVGAQATLATSLVVREDALTLYGFAEQGERDVFELVQTASGVGPKLALAIVSTLSPDDLRAAIAGGNVAALTKVPGVGPKGAQRLILELKDRIGAVAVAAQATQPPEPVWREQVRSGLVGLGWSPKDAESACDKVAGMAADETVSIAQLMRAALQSLARN